MNQDSSLSFWIYKSTEFSKKNKRIQIRMGFFTDRKFLNQTYQNKLAFQAILAK